MESNVADAIDGAHAPTPESDDTYYACHDPESPARCSTTLVHALADLLDTDVSDLEFSLAEHVNPEALDALFSAPDEETDRPLGHVAFSVEGCRVTVYSDGQIVLTPP